MTQRRTPSGQGPARRGTQSGRPALREGAPRGEPRGAARRGTGADPVRSGNRPAAARSSSRAAATARRADGDGVKRTTATRPRRFTGRATVLLVVLVSLALGYTYPVRVYLSQQSDIARMEAAQADQRRRIQELTEQVAKWQDDEYVRIQARRRFYFVRPGEIPLVVWDSDKTPGDTDARRAPTPPAPPPWYETMWSSIRAADRQPER